MNGGVDTGLICDIPDFEDAYSHVTVPDMLAVLFANQMRLNLGVDSNTMTVDLFIIYADLLEKVDEVTAQRALKTGVPSYYNQVLAYGHRTDLLVKQQGDIYDLI